MKMKVITINVPTPYYKAIKKIAELEFGGNVSHLVRYAVRAMIEKQSRFLRDLQLENIKKKMEIRLKILEGFE